MDASQRSDYNGVSHILEAPSKPPPSSPSAPVPVHDCVPHDPASFRNRELKDNLGMITHLPTETHVEFMLRLITGARKSCPPTRMTFFESLDELLTDYIAV